MLPIKTYKKCLCCGNTYGIGESKKNCTCGGYLYTVGQYYQKKPVYRTPKIQKGTYYPPGKGAPTLESGDRIKYNDRERNINTLTD